MTIKAQPRQAPEERVINILLDEYAYAALARGEKVQQTFTLGGKRLILVLERYIPPLKAGQEQL